MKTVDQDPLALCQNCRYSSNDREMDNACDDGQDMTEEDDDPETALQLSDHWPW